MSETQTAQPQGALSIDAATALLAQSPEPEKQEEAAPEAAKPEVQAETGVQEEIVEPEAQGEEEIDLEFDAEEEVAPEPAAPEIPPPQSWSKEDAAEWAKLTPEARAIVARREADRDKAVSKSVQEASELRRQVQAYADETARLAKLGSDSFEAKWQEKAKGPINWAVAMEQAQTDEEFNQILRSKAQYDADKAEVERAQKAATEQEQSAYAAFHAEQNKLLPDLAPELVGDAPSVKARWESMGKLLFETGFQQEDLKAISAAELRIASLAVDGLKYREAQKKAREKASATPNQRLNGKPAKSLGPSAQQAVPSKARALQGLETRLTQRGSIDDAVNLLVARQQVRSS